VSSAVYCQGAVTVVWACAVIAVAVLATMVYSLIAFYRSAAAGARPATGISAQLVWSLIPIGIFLGIAVPAIKALLFTGDHCSR